MISQESEVFIDYQGQKLKASSVIEALSSFVSEGRKTKIDKVLSERSSYFVPILEGLYDRGNISAVMRSAEAFGFYKMHIIETCEKFKESQRVTQGADKWLDIYRWKNTASCFKNLKSAGFKIYTTHLSEEAQHIEDLDFENHKIAVVLGNEKEGVSKEALELADGNVLLPMVGFTQSFNISVAAALSFQRAYLKKPKKIGFAELERLKALYYLRSINWPLKALLEQIDKSSNP